MRCERHLVKHPDEVEAHDTLVVANHLHGINLGAVQVLPSKLQPSRLVPCAYEYCMSCMTSSVSVAVADQAYLFAVVVCIATPTVILELHCSATMQRWFHQALSMLAWLQMIF